MGPKGVVGENFDGFRLNGKQEWLTSSDRADVSDTYGGSGMFASPGKVESEPPYLSMIIFQTHIKVVGDHYTGLENIAWE